MRYFVTVAEELHFGRAAVRLHIAQPPLSQQIKSLESELGVPLFTRTKRRVELTDAGRLLLPEARATLAQAQRTGDMARAVATGTKGHLSIGFVTSAGYSVLPESVLAFRDRHPGITIELNEMIPARQIEALERGEIGLGIMRPPLAHPDLDSEVILSEPMVIALPRHHPLAGKKAIALKDLRNDPFVLFPRKHGPGIYDVITKACEDAGFTCSPAYEPNEMQSVLAHVASGLGVSVVPASLTSFQSTLIAYRRIRSPSMFIDLNLAWARHRDSATVDAFRNIVRVIGKKCLKELHRTCDGKG